MQFLMCAGDAIPSSLQQNRVATALRRKVKAKKRFSLKNWRFYVLFVANKLFRNIMMICWATFLYGEWGRHGLSSVFFSLVQLKEKRTASQKIVTWIVIQMPCLVLLKKCRRSSCEREKWTGTVSELVGWGKNDSSELNWLGTHSHHFQLPTNNIDLTVCRAVVFCCGDDPMLRYVSCIVRLYSIFSPVKFSCLLEKKNKERDSKIER